MISMEEWRSTGKRFSWNGRDIFYHEEGQGEPLVLIHGFPTCSWDWHKVWRTLAGKYRCIAMDMLGYGFSAKPRPHRYSLFEQADLHEALLRELGIDAAHVLAHDYGDTVLQELLARQKESKQKIRVLSAYMLNGGIIPGQHRPRLVQRLLVGPLGPIVGMLMSRRSFRKSFSEVFAVGCQPSLAELDAWWEMIRNNDGLGVMHLLSQYQIERKRNFERWVSVLRESPIPLRFLAGADDPVSGRHMVESFRGLAAGPRDCGLLEDIGHYPQTEAPEAVLRDYADFRSRIDG